LLKGKEIEACSRRVFGKDSKRPWRVLKRRKGLCEGREKKWKGGLGRALSGEVVLGESKREK